ncbi:autophagy-related 12 isoform X2 [Rhodnius prolixus]|uniref:Ubiquitin-like protein ATG12 n=2 Tax=Rhodnius TaxID=13248 RepID=T1IDR9_RHOPR
MSEVENVGSADQDIQDTDISEGVQECQQAKKEKITVLLKATANAPIIKKRKWMVEPDRKIGAIAAFVRKYLQLEPSESLFLYVNQTFAPSPDQIVKNLYDCFGTDGTLILHYCKTPAWG